MAQSFQGQGRIEARVGVGKGDFPVERVTADPPIGDQIVNGDFGCLAHE